MNHSVKTRRQALHQTHHHYYLNISVEAANLSDWRIESEKSIRQRESNRIESKLFRPNWNALAKWSNFSGFSHLPLLTYSCNLAAHVSC